MGSVIGRIYGFENKVDGVGMKVAKAIAKASVKANMKRNQKRHHLLPLLLKWI
jgi:hypothetical protein